MEDDDTDEVWTEPFKCPDTNEGDTEVSHFGRDHSNIPASKHGHSRTIVHIDIDCFYAQVEMLYNPVLRDKPLGIQQKNIVVTCNYEARKWGVTKLMYITDAKKKCPELVLVSGEDLTNYRHKSYEISEFLQKYTPYVERLGFDENFMDVSEMVAWRLQDGNYKPEFKGHVYNGDSQGISKTSCGCGCELRLQIGSQIAADMREAMEKELGITSCAGVAHNKLLSKLVAATHKPNQQTSILPHMCLQLVTSLPSVRGLPGIGSRTSRRLQGLGISAITDLHNCDFRVLKREFGSALAQQLAHLCYGVDDSPVVTFSLPQTLSDEDSFKCCKDYSDVEGRIRELLTSLLKRVVEDGRTPQTARLTVRRVNNNYNKESRQCSVPASIFTKCHKTSSTETACERLMPIVMNLFSKLVDSSKPFHLTLINICFAKLVKPGDEQGKISSFFTKVSDSGRESTSQNNEDTSRKHASDTVLSKATQSHSEKRKAAGKSPVKGKTMMHFPTNASISSQQSTVENSGITTQTNHFDDSTEALLLTQNVEQRPMRDTSKNTPLSTAGEPYELGSCHEPGSYSQTENLHQQKEEITHSRSSSDDKQEHLPQENSDSSQQGGEENFLQSLLPETVDARTIKELPNEIMKEVLLQYGILVEDLPEGRRFTLLSDKVVTRSKKLDAVALKQRKPLFSPRKKRAPKHSLKQDEDVEHVSKSRRKLLHEEHDTSTEIMHVPDSPESPSSLCSNLNLPLTNIEREIKDASDQVDEHKSSSLQECQQYLPVASSDYSRPKKNSVDETDSGIFRDSSVLVDECETIRFNTTEKDQEKSVTSTQEVENSHAVISLSVEDVDLDSAVSVSSGRKVISDKLQSSNSENCLYNSSHCTSASPSSANIKMCKVSDQLCQDSSLDIKFGASGNISISEKKSVLLVVPPVRKPDEHHVDLSDSSSSLREMDHRVDEQQTVVNVCRSNAHLFGESSTTSPKGSSRQELHKNLPGDIDPDVFAALPRNIQGEIMAHIMMGTSQSQAQSQESPSGYTPMVKSPPDKRKKDSTSPPQKGQNTLLSYFKKK